MNPDEPTSSDDTSEVNPGSPNLAAAGAEAAPALQSERAALDWRGLAKRLLFCNPFYLCSAALLLYGIGRLSTDPNFLNDETRNLLFNFSALQIYEFLLVGTAIVLAARRIWYDSALLIVVENGLVLVPFMLISQATLIDKTLAWVLSLAGGCAVAGRFYSIRRKYPQFYLPEGALLLGAVVLGCNLALPHVFRPWVDGDLEEWRGPARILWFVVLPVLVAGANLLPRPVRYGCLSCERSWLPLFNYGLWIIGSGVHLWCVGYICKLPFEVVSIAPAACAAAWTVFNRLRDCLQHPSAELRKAVLILAFLAPLLAAKGPLVFVVLTALNIVGFTLACIRADAAVRRIAKELAFLSAAMMFAGLPAEWLSDLSRRDHIFSAAVVYYVLLALRSTDPRAGVIGSVAVAIGVSWLVRDWTLHAAVQASCVFLLLHSLRWPRGVHGGGDSVRFIVAMGWVAHAFWWTQHGGWAASGFVGGAAILVVAIWAVFVWRIDGHRLLVIPSSAAIALLSGPANWFYAYAPVGVVALAGSLALFALGTWFAWNRAAWEGK